MNLIVVNSFNLYKLKCKESETKAIRHKQFRKLLYKDLLALSTNVETTMVDPNATLNNIEKLEVQLTDDMDIWVPFLLKKSDAIIKSTRPNKRGQPKHLKRAYQTLT